MGKAEIILILHGISFRGELGATPDKEKLEKLNGGNGKSAMWVTNMDIDSALSVCDRCGMYRAYIML